MTRQLLSLILLALASCQPAHAGYSLFVRPQVAPATILVQRGDRQEARRNPGPAPTYPATYQGLVCRSAGFSLYSSAVDRRTEVWEDSAGTATGPVVLAACPTLRAQVSTQILEIRKTALGRIATDAAGVLAVYDENYRAARAVLDGAGDTTFARDGQTATAYLAGFGSRLGMDAGQFAAWLISQNQQIGVRAGRVEDEYLRLTYSIIPAETNIDRLLAYPAEYRRFCGP